MQVIMAFSRDILKIKLILPKISEDMASAMLVVHAKLMKKTDDVL